ncbi:hypothetical protein SCHPADRAFT_926722, partial [Schizopora paradoxa]
MFPSNLRIRCKKLFKRFSRSRRSHNPEATKGTAGPVPMGLKDRQSIYNWTMSLPSPTEYEDRHQRDTASQRGPNSVDSPISYTDGRSYSYCGSEVSNSVVEDRFRPVENYAVARRSLSPDFETSQENFRNYNISFFKLVFVMAQMLASDGFSMLQVLASVQEVKIITSPVEKKITTSLFGLSLQIQISDDRKTSAHSLSISNLSSPKVSSASRSLRQEELKNDEGFYRSHGVCSIPAAYRLVLCCVVFMLLLKE